MSTSDTDGLSFIVIAAMLTNKSHAIIATHVNKRTERSETNVVLRFRLLVRLSQWTFLPTWQYYTFLTDRVLFLTEITVFLSILLYFLLRFRYSFINLVLYLTEHLGKIDQSLQTGCISYMIMLQPWDYCGLCGGKCF